MSILEDEPVLDPSLLARLQPIRLLCLDVDGVLTMVICTLRAVKAMRGLVSASQYATAWESSC